ncbi:head-tail connector protein [Piscirickettsia litoralis]|uniref:Phage gp6-like head-tail connector protein n=1 Tax=Piscirickettsia litoralis TaxID=1891921 RepID=A0ABX2ZWQ9_9GAMM|nr:head-tail connector protein [Piscirickettsia litoralis]ODN40997.1 hypothetical protein BGC07_18365 [Piscirickettsia litoralis]
MLNLDVVKSHLRLSGNTEDTYLQLLLSAARQAAEDYINRKIVDTAEEQGAAENALVLNDKVIIAILMTVGHFYENRESTSTLTIKEVPLTTHYLLNPYRNLTA